MLRAMGTAQLSYVALVDQAVACTRTGACETALKLYLHADQLVEVDHYLGKQAAHLTCGGSNSGVAVSGRMRTIKQT